jgi:hypothetical protein
MWLPAAKGGLGPAGAAGGRAAERQACDGGLSELRSLMTAGAGVVVAVVAGVD